MSTSTTINSDDFIKICTGFYRNSGSHKKFYKQLADGRVFTVFDGYTITDDLEIKGVKLSGIEFRNCVLKTLHLDAGSNIRSLLITDNSTIERILILNSSKIASLTLSNTSSINILAIGEGSVNSFTINEKAFIHSFTVLQNSTLDDIIITISRIGNISIQNSKINDLKSSFSTIGDFTFQSSIVNRATVNDCRINSFELTDLLLPSKIFDINSSCIGSLIIKSDIEFELLIKDSTLYKIIANEHKLSSKVNLQISNALINSLDFNHFINSNRVTLNNIKATNKLYPFKKSSRNKIILNKREFEFEEVERKSQVWIINSDLGNTQMIGCDWESFDEFLFQNSKLLDVFAAGITLPNKDKILTLGIEGDIVHELEQKRLVFNQFKKIHERQGDNVRATQYLAEELEIYRKQLNHLKTTTPIEYWNKRAEQFNLWINKTSSYYGNNWLRAVVITLIVNTVLFTMYCWSLGFLPGKDFNLFSRLLSYSFEFLNPLRKVEFLVDEVHISPLSRTIDYISRIIIAYFVYQTIQAFRKFGKRSV